MIFILPEPDRNFTINQIFLNLYHQHPEMRLYDGDGVRVNFIISGSLPQVSYTGEVNNIGPLMFHGNCMNMFKGYHETGAAVTIDCSSHLITDFNNYDVMGNMALSIGNGYGDTGIKVSNNYAYDYFHAKYPNCRMIAAAHYTDDPGDRVFFLKEMWSDIDNTLIKSPRVAIRINSICDSCDIEQRMKCLESENLNATMFSNVSVLQSCSKCHANINAFAAQNDFLPSLQQEGFKNFILPNYYQYPILQAQEYVKNLIKPEYQQIALNHIMLIWQTEGKK